MGDFLTDPPPRACCHTCWNIVDVCGCGRTASMSRHPSSYNPVEEAHSLLESDAEIPPDLAELVRMWLNRQFEIAERDAAAWLQQQASTIDEEWRNFS